MATKLLLPEAARGWVLRRYQNQHRNWMVGEGAWPLVVGLGAPTEQDIAQGAAAVRAWVQAWQAYAGPGVVRFEQRRFARLGVQRLPVAWELQGPADAAAAVGQGDRWARAMRRYQPLVRQWAAPGIERSLAAHFDVWADYADVDHERLQAMISWLLAYPDSGLYLRQLPVPGLDTKWLEKRTGLVASLLRAAKPAPQEGADFHQLAGLRKPTQRIRLRLLCPALRACVGGLGDVEGPLEQVAQLPINPAAVLVVENLETGLALPEWPGTVVVMRLGHAVGALAQLPWLHRARVRYWGDIDTHGFSILNRARVAVPQLQSVLMDEATLLSHRPLWVEEPVPCPDGAMPALTAEELGLYVKLRSGVWGNSVRLEQERVDWGVALGALEGALGLRWGSGGH